MCIGDEKSLARGSKSGPRGYEGKRNKRERVTLERGTDSNDKSRGERVEAVATLTALTTLFVTRHETNPSRETRTWLNHGETEPFVRTTSWPRGVLCSIANRKHCKASLVRLAQCATRLIASDHSWHIDEPTTQRAMTRWTQSIHRSSRYVCVSCCVAEPTMLPFLRATFCWSSASDEAQTANSYLERNRARQTHCLKHCHATTF